MARAFSIGDDLPECSRGDKAPFRVVGTGYARKYRAALAQARTVRDPAGQCTGCHTLTTQLTGQRFAADAVARPPWVSFPSWAQLLTLQDERFVYAQVAAHRTDWALRSGPGKIHPRSEEHTSELQSLMRISYAVFCLTKKNKHTMHRHEH